MSNRHRPPQLAGRILRWYAGEAAVEDLQGDLDELFYLNLRTMSPIRAKYEYWLRVLSLFGSYVIKKRRQRVSLPSYSNNAINVGMITNYLTMAWRVMARNRVYTLINVLGLTMGISACIVVFLVVNHEFSFDRFHADREKIFRLKTYEEASPGSMCACVPSAVYPTLRDEYAGAEAITGYHDFDAKTSVTVDGQVKRFDRNSGRIIITNPEYFKIFHYEWLAGNPDVLSKPLHVVLTANRARAYFGSTAPQDLIGKYVTYNDSLQLTVAGIVNDWTEKSDFVHSEFISFSTIENTFIRKQIQLDNWGGRWHSSQSFIKLRPGDNVDEVADRIKSIVRNKTTEKIGFQLESLADIHFRTEKESESAGGSKLLSTLSIQGSLALFILVIAAINFINLSTAQSTMRSREIGIRKVMGSRKLEIIIQFMCETFILTLISLLFSLALVQPLLIAFGTYIPGVTFDLMAIETWLFLTGLLIATSILAGVYPALVMSSQLPVNNLASRRLSVDRGVFSLRRGLVVFQFVVSLFFITTTLVISVQMDFIKTKDRGFSTAGVMTFRTNWSGPVDKVQTLAARIRSFAGSERVTVQGFTPMGFTMWINSFEYTADDGKVTGVSSVKAGDEHYIPMYRIRLIAGRNFLPSDSVSEVVVNEAFVKTLGIDDPQKAIGEHIRLAANNRLISICGVVQDFHQQSFRDAIGPCIIGNFKHEQHSISVRFREEGMLANVEEIAKIETEFKSIYPDETFSYHFIEEEIGWMHREEAKTSNLTKIAMGVTIFISCMGVFGLSMFTATRRTREIGIRKVLGASVWRIVSMLNREFIELIVLAVLIATPIAWYYLNDWLLGFTYRVPLRWWYFPSAGFIALLTALLTVSFQSLKAANSDPVKALKTE